MQTENIVDYTGRLQGRSSVGGQSMNAVYAATSEAQEMEGYKTLPLRSTPFLSYGRNVVTLKRTCLLLHISSAPFHLILTVVISCGHCLKPFYHIYSTLNLNLKMEAACYTKTLMSTDKMRGATI